MTYAGIELTIIDPAAGCTTTTTTTTAHCTYYISIKEMSYILLIASGLRFTGMLLKIQQEIVYTQALKATWTANDSD